MNATAELYGYRLTADGRLHGSTKCWTCRRTGRQASRDHGRRILVRLDPFNRIPICDACHEAVQTSRTRAKPSAGSD